jgi:hypothetical protein
VFRRSTNRATYLTHYILLFIKLILPGDWQSIKFTIKKCSHFSYCFSFHKSASIAPSSRLYAQSMLFPHFYSTPLAVQQSVPESPAACWHIDRFLQNTGCLRKCALNLGSNLSRRVHKNTAAHNSVWANRIISVCTKHTHIIITLGRETGF